MRSDWKIYFLFSEKEQKGIVVLGIILGLSIFVSWMSSIGKENTLTNKRFAIDAKSSALFYFNPNTIDSVQALQLGIPPKQVKTLLAYRRKGGRFYKKEHFGKIYGLSPALLDRLMPYVRIEEHDAQKKLQNATNYKQFKYLNWVIDINRADEQEWLQKTTLPSFLVKRILNYKNYLGSFERVGQLRQVYGMSDSTYQYLKPHLIYTKNQYQKLSAQSMNYKKWQSLRMFSNKEIALIINRRAQNGGKIGWREIVILCDLTEEQANILKDKIYISD